MASSAVEASDGISGFNNEHTFNPDSAEPHILGYNSRRFELGQNLGATDGYLSQVSSDVLGPKQTIENSHLTGKSTAPFIFPGNTSF